jgi:DEAD/DEAH box helicase
MSGGLLRSQSRLFGNFTLRTTTFTTEPSWSEAEAEARRADAIRIASAAITAEEAGDLTLARVAFRRAAELFEWLVPENLDDESRLLSAALYQLAELPAMAGSVIGASDDLYSAFLAADFAAFEDFASQHSELFGLDPEEAPSDQSASGTMQRLLLSALNVIAADMRWGDDRVAEAHNALAQLTDYYRLSRMVSGWLLARAFTTIAQQYSASSLRSVTAPIRDQLSEDGVRALERYIRGAYRSGRPLAWPTQRYGLAQISTSGSYALCTPTGSGKTTVAEIAILHSLYQARSGWDDIGLGRLALYIVPSRALAAEVESRLASSFDDRDAFPIRVVSSYGGNDVAATEDWLTSQAATVIVCTQEKTDGLLRAAGPLFAGRLRLVIVDEAHRVTVGDGSYERPLRLETLIARLRSLRGDDLRIIGLSAVLSSDDESLGRWFNAEQPVNIRVPYQSTRRLFGRLVISGTGEFIAEYDLVNGALVGGAQNSGERPRIPNIVPRCDQLPKVTKGKKRGTWLGTDLQLRAAALWTATHLVSMSPSGGAVLIAVGSKIEDYAASFLDYLNRFEDLPHFFDGPGSGPERAIWQRATAACSDYFGEHSHEYQLLIRGIVVHHGRLPVALSRYFIRLIDMRVVRVCLATSTLSEGVNLPFETILLPSLRGHSGRTRYSAEEIRNLIGRAGRPGYAREGRALVLLGAGAAFGKSAKIYQGLLNELSGDAEPLKPQSALAFILRTFF